MTATHLPGQLELATVIDHKRCTILTDAVISASGSTGIPRDVQIAKLLRQYEDRPTSETWSRIQSLAAEILR
jgi:hypothetical protein